MNQDKGTAAPITDEKRVISHNTLSCFDCEFVFYHILF